MRPALTVLALALAAALVAGLWMTQPGDVAIVHRERLVVATVEIPVVIYAQVTITPTPRPTRTPTPVGYVTPTPRPTATPTPIPLNDHRPVSPGELIGGARQGFCTGHGPGGC